MRLKFGKGDILAIGIVAVLAIVSALVFSLNVSSDDRETVSVYMDGELYDTFSLEENQEVILQGKYTNKLVIQNGQAAITKSDCPGEDCVYSGWIKEEGRTIVCLPNRVEVRIDGADSDVDIILR